MVLDVGRRRRVGIHPACANAARTVRLKALERVGVEEHRPAHRVGLAEKAADFPRTGEPCRQKRLLDLRPALLRRGGFHGRDGQRRYAKHVANGLRLEVYEVGNALRMVERAVRQRGERRSYAGGRHDALRAGDVPAGLRRPHPDAEETFFHVLLTTAHPYAFDGACTLIFAFCEILFPAGSRTLTVAGVNAARDRIMSNLFMYPPPRSATSSTHDRPASHP